MTSCKPSRGIKQDFTFQIEYLRSLKLSWTYPKLIEQQRWSLSAETASIYEYLGSIVYTSRKQVLIFLICSTSRRIGNNKEKRVEEKCFYFWTFQDFWRHSKSKLKCWCKRPGWKQLHRMNSYYTIWKRNEKVVGRARRTWCRSCSRVFEERDWGSRDHCPQFSCKSDKANAKALYVPHECQDGTVSTRLVAARSRYVGAIKVHEYCALRTYGSTGWSQSNIKDLRSIGDSQKQSPILGRQGKSWFFGARTESKFQNILSVIEMEKFILSLV